MDRAFRKLFEGTTRTRFEAVVESVDGRRHVVKDVLGKRYGVDCETRYAPGSRVVVVGGAIVGRAGAEQTIKVIEV